MKTRQNAKIRKPIILLNFYKVIVEEGFEGASIAKIAKRMGIHPSLIIHYFTTKENMTIELVDYFIRQYTKILKSMETEITDLEERLNTLIETIWSRKWHEVIDMAAVFEVVSISFRNKTILDRMKNLYKSYKEYLIDEFKKFIDAGLIQVNDPERAAEIIISMVEGSRHFRHFFVKKSSLDSYNKDMIKSALSILKNGGL